MNEHLDDTDFFSLLEGVIEPQKQQQMKTHLSTCPTCETRYRSAEQFLALIERSYPETTIEEVPQHLITWALDHIPVHPASSETISPLKELTGRIKKLVAVLSPVLPEPAFARGTPETIRLLYTAQEMEIPLCAVPSSSGGRWALIGRITDVSDGDQWEVSLYSGDERVSTCLIGSDEEFLFPGLSPGKYRLTLLMPHDIAIDIPPFQIG